MRIRTKVLSVLLVFSLVPLGILGVLSLSSVNSVGDEGLDSAESIAANSEIKATEIISSLEERRIAVKARDACKLAKTILEDAAPVSIDEIMDPNSDIHMKLENLVVSVIEPGPADLPEDLKPYYGYTVLTCNNLGHPDMQEEIGEVRIIAHPTIKTPIPFNVEGTELENLTRKALDQMEVSGRYHWEHTVTGEVGMKYAHWDQFFFRTEDGVRRRFAIMATMWLNVYTRPVQELEEHNEDVLKSTKEDLNNSISQYRNYAIIGLISMIIIVPIAGILFARRILVNPIERLTDAADKLSRGEMDVDVTVDTEDEIGELSDAFERLRNSLEKMMERIREE